MKQAEQDSHIGDGPIEEWEDPYFGWFLYIVRERMVGDPCLRRVEGTQEGIVFEILNAQSREIESVLVPWNTLRQIRSPYRLASRRILRPDAQA